MEDIKVGDMVYGDPDCPSLNSAYHDIVMKVERTVEPESGKPEDRVLYVIQKVTDKLDETFPIMTFAVKKYIPPIESEMPYRERVEYWAKYFNVFVPYKPSQGS